MVVALDMLSFALARKGWHRFIGTFLLFYAQVITTEFLLGLASYLYDYSLATVNIALTMLLIIALRQKYGQKIFREYFLNIKTLPKLLMSTARQDRFLSILCVLALSFVGWITFLAILFPPLDWDGNAYHLTYAADLVQNHHIYDIPASMPWLPGYPKGGELIQAWTVLLAHNDTLIELAQLPFLLLAVGALYGIARSLRISKRSSRFSAVLFAFTPMVMNQLITGYIDVMLCGIFFAALALILRKTYRKLDLLLIGISFSLIISIKASGVYFIIALGALLLWNLYRRYKLKPGAYITPILLVALPMVFGIYWYIKNLVLYGSPLYPFGFKIGDKTIFEGPDFNQWSAVIGAGMPDNTFLRLWHTWSEHIPDPKQFQYDYSSNYFGLGIIWFVVLIPSLILAIHFAIRQRRYYLLSTLGVLFTLLLVFPTNYSPRYTIFILSTGIIALGLVLDNLNRLTITITKSVVVILALTTLLANLCVWSYAPANIENQVSSISSSNGLRGPGTIFSINMGNAYEIVRRNAGKDDTVVYTAGNWIYPLWNNNFSNRVVYVEAKTKESWLMQVINQSGDYIFTTTEPSVEQNQWAADTFKNIIYKDATYVVYKVH